MRNKKIIIAGLIAPAFFYYSVSAATVIFAATKGEQMLQNMINAESARIAELNVRLDPKLGITGALHKQSRGNGVKLLQQFLKLYGVYPEGLITGYFGSLTESAVKKFQRKESIDAVGIVGPKTRARIKEIIRKQSASNSAAASGTSTPSLDFPAIVDIALASDIADDGSAVGAADSFASTTRNIYAVLHLQKISQNAKIAYIRYYQGDYLDSEVSHPSRNNLKYFHFQWSLKPGTGRTIGNYSLVFYLDDKSVKTVQYSIY